MIGLDAGEEAFARAAVVAVQVYPRHAADLRDVRSWFLRLARNVCIDLLRARRRHVSLHEPEIEAVAASLGMGHSRSPEQILLRNELAQRIAESVHQLPALYRVTLQLHLDEHSPRDIADLLDISEANARKRLQVARDLLRRVLNDYAAGRPKRLRSRGAARRPVKERRIFVRVIAVTDRGTPRELILFSDERPRRASARRTERTRGHMMKHPRGWKAIVEYARALRDAGSFDDAIREYRRAILRRPQSAEPLVECAALLVAGGDADEAMRITESALFVLRGTQRTRAELWLAIARGDAPAIARAAHDPALPPSDVAAAAAALLRLEQPRAAGAAIERLLATMSGDPTLLVLDHDALRAAGANAVADLRLEQAAKADRHHPLLLRRRIKRTVE
jgi:RNA polymerase sigma factor (sigma-70 family)